MPKTRIERTLYFISRAVLATIAGEWPIRTDRSVPGIGGSLQFRIQSLKGARFGR
jgi:hypothetical protein